MSKPVRAASLAAVISLVPATAAGGAPTPTVPPVLRPVAPAVRHSVMVQMRHAGARFATHRRLAHRNVSLAHRLASLRDHHLGASYAGRVSRWSDTRLRADNARKSAAIKRLTTPPPAPVSTQSSTESTSSSGSGTTTSTGSGAAPSNMQAIAQCESGGNPAAVGGGGTYRGLYQFDQQTWQSVGGSGDPAAASPAEQTQRAQALYAQRGSSAWPVCGK